MPAQFWPPDCVTDEIKECADELVKMLFASGTQHARIEPVLALMTEKHQVHACLKALEDFALCSIKLDQEAFLEKVAEAWNQYQIMLKAAVKKKGAKADDKKKDDDFPEFMKNLEEMRNALAEVNVNATRLRVKRFPIEYAGKPFAKVEEEGAEGEGGAAAEGAPAADGAAA